ncbi:sensor domain-containing diguanylate cyclase [Halothiobacillus sp.]|uniref:GGDEF domain-containing protein n=1 Tax=Halothiobacillus sp. TaxID=1891311 RepID=UPI002AD3374F|nr:sensor domain-containing diguanylate cyclase [Halothiobacillus sp.]
MTKATSLCPIPENEAQRLQAVRSYQVLDTPPEVDFDTLTRMATQIFNAPAAEIGLMDSERLWFKSQIGMGLPQLDRQIAFCAHAIMCPDALLIVEDLLEDPRFRDNPLVVNPPYLRFYAGAPLIDPHGFVLGTLAVVDIKPRTFSVAQRNMLRDLSTLVITALESRRRAALLSELALTDPLTGLANRIQFERTLTSEIAHARRTDEPFSVFFLDLDGFKDVNDTYGHAVGDEVLQEIARRMAQQIRAEDLLARLGGDEFGLFMREGQGAPANALASRLAEAIAAPLTLPSGETLQMGISIGISAYTDDIDSVATLINRADQAMYEVKRGR